MSNLFCVSACVSASQTFIRNIWQSDIIFGEATQAKPPGIYTKAWNFTLYDFFIYKNLDTSKKQDNLRSVFVYKKNPDTLRYAIFHGIFEIGGGGEHFYKQKTIHFALNFYMQKTMHFPLRFYL